MAGNLFIKQKFAGKLPYTVAAPSTLLPSELSAVPPKALIHSITITLKKQKNSSKHQKHNSRYFILIKVFFVES